MSETGFTVGELIESRYRVLSVIESGGMGILYRVSDEAQDGEIVALKMVRLDISTMEAPESVERFRREFQLLTQLRHPNLVSVYDYGITTEGKLYFTMEWVEGQDLEPKLHPLEPGATIPVMVQICRALAYLHARGVIHGDLKPHNVLMAGDAGDAGHAHDQHHRAKLVDFGVAFEIRSPETRARYYTPGYAAPETRQPRPIDHRADLYSLGALWYALLVGEPPMFMPGAGKERLIRFALDEALEAQSQVPIKIGTVIARLMATSPKARYDSANEVIAAVNEITGSEYALETRETASSYALRTHFVNRETEIATLQALWEQAQSDEGKLVLISGESGVGKTRLVLELEVQAEMEGARVVWGQCVESGGSAYQPWREVLRVLVRYVEGADEAAGETAMQQVGPVLTTLLPGLWEREYMRTLAPPADLDPQAAQQRLNNSIVQVLQAAAGLRPTVIVIENMHWADEATLEFLRFLARIPGHVGLLMCVTYRDDEIGADHTLEKLAGEQVQRIRVCRLSPEVTTELVRSMLGLAQLPALLTERVQQTTGGNAFFVQELIRSLATEGEVLRRTVGGWEVDGKALQEAELPESIRQVVGRRMGQLSPEGRQVLSWAAAMGMVFWEGGIAEVGRSPVGADAPTGQVPWQRVRVTLREGIEQGLVVVRDETSLAGEREYLFLNPTVWEASYESVPPEERRGNHALVAAWLMARSDEEADEHLGLIADHLERAGQTEQAVIYLRRAGEQAAAQFANTEAIAYFSRALELTPEDNQAGRYALLLAREQVYHLQGARKAQSQDLATLEELAETMDDDRKQAEVALRQAGYAAVTGDYLEAIVAARAAINLGQTMQDVVTEAMGHLQWGSALRRQAKYEAASAQFEQALTLARAASLRHVEADCLLNMGLVLEQLGDLAKSKSYCEQSLPIYRELGDRKGESAVLNSLGLVSLYSGDYAGAIVYYEQSLRIGQEIGERRRQCVALGNFGGVFRTLGEYERAKDSYEQSLRIAREIGERGRESDKLFNLGLLLHQMGDDETAREYSQQGLTIAQEIGERRLQGYASTILGHALAGLERLAEAADVYRQALDIRRELGEHNLAMEPLAGLARVTLAQGNLDQAQSHVEEILSYLETDTLEGTHEPFRVYLTCYRVLCANQDPRAQVVLNTAHRLLQERAARISDEELRRAFLENVAAHREIIKAWETSALHLQD